MAGFAFPISHLVDPVFLTLVGLVAGLWLSRCRDSDPRAKRAWDRERIGRAAAWSACIALWLLATPRVASPLARWVADRPHDLRADLEGSTPEQRAMVVLSAGISPDDLGTPAMERLSDASFDRSIGAARIYKTYGFGWVIVSGRDPDLGPTELAEGMADMMAAFGVPREKILLETQATDTKENAFFSARMLHELHPTRVVVVTSALHMPRAVRWFARAGLQVIPAPVKLDPPPPEGVKGLIPSSTALLRCDRVLHELFGRLEP